MRLTILNVAYPLAPVGPDAVGGAEQILSKLDQALTRAGHHSLVIACEGSKVAGTLVPVPANRGALTESTRQYAHEQHRRAIQETLERWRVDVIHAHGVDFDRYLPPSGVPMLVTLHLPPS